MNEPIVIIIITVIVVIFILAIFFSKKAIIKRKLKKAELKKLSQFRNGDTAKIVGQVELVDQALTAPLSGRKCAYYYAHVEQEVSSGKNSRWKTLIEEEVSGEYLIRDGSECAYISSKHVKSYIVQDRKFRSGFMNDASQALERYLNNKGYESENMLGFNKTLRYKEGILEAGETIAVFGCGQWKSASELGLPEELGQVLAINDPDEGTVYLSDDPDTTKNTAKANTINQSDNYGQADSRYFQKTSESKYFKKS
ncbi:hypothetical protein [Carboxylicivirga marina]|uniref:RING-type E3 ubiquitin transferase n=1 Tax=Carboxylicivirga marina TaxID=2800988 RepID=A0ABS1HKX7_9BACT|nr:hypothetical protein [Carboxylicivirga marina]MBK3518212.1 hypothetical protein [Carboxylicivirga marina]